MRRGWVANLEHSIRRLSTSGVAGLGGSATAGSIPIGARADRSSTVHASPISRGAATWRNWWFRWPSGSEKWLRSDRRHRSMAISGGAMSSGGPGGDRGWSIHHFMGVILRRTWECSRSSGAYRAGCSGRTARSTPWMTGGRIGWRCGSCTRYSSTPAFSAEGIAIRSSISPGVLAVRGVDPPRTG